MSSNDTSSLAHTTWNCKYHIVFAPKYRRKVFYEEKRYEIREILRTLCKWKDVEIVEGEVCPDHIHILVKIPPKMSVSGFMGYLKGKSSLMIFQKWGEYEICIPKPRILVPWILCRHGRQEHGKDKRVHSKPTQTR